MIKTDSTQKGFILVLTVMLLSIGLLVVSQLVHQGTLHIHFDHVMINREKAKLLTLSGIQLAMNQLSVLDATTTTMAASPTSPDKKIKEFLEKVFPTMNRWQEIILRKDTDGIEGTIRFSISFENGKIPLNGIFDFQQKKFKGEGAPQGDLKKVIKEFFVSMKKFTKDKDLFDVFEKFLKQRQYKLNDVTELLTDAEFEKVFKVSTFYEPPSLDKTENRERPLYLTDIFTVFSDELTIQPWLLSDSLQGMLLLKRAQSGDIKNRKEQAKQLAQEFKPSQSVQELWDNSLQKIYGRDFKALPADITTLFTVKFEPMVFSVLCYGMVGGITQKALAIIEKIKSSGSNTFALKKLYWL